MQAKQAANPANEDDRISLPDPREYFIVTSFRWNGECQVAEQHDGKKYDE
ncbi:hypothetical protein [Geobacter sp. SVR]|nr:hypothetical protein [Geobacter sp. SVR]BCS54725.1 hypothetical protein GSVR_30330 [Geobacter sp. SVR]GCF86467.1 hypothetical protein GSbR_30670 [Geobacter sp. SVR]